MFTGLEESVRTIVFNIEGLREEWLILGRSTIFFALGILAIMVLLVIDWFREKNMNISLEVLPSSIRVFAYGAVIAFILLFGRFDETEFIYFQF